MIASWYRVRRIDIDGSRRHDHWRRIDDRPRGDIDRVWIRVRIGGRIRMHCRTDCSAHRNAGRNCPRRTPWRTVATWTDYRAIWTGCMHHSGTAMWPPVSHCSGARRDDTSDTGRDADYATEHMRNF
ncbi:hypothetical protein AA0473_1062 [Acetobacter orleanensis NRIC 0473]|uniref:Uncharacterized protein n=1 Tax=Acetobacter orleanensis TaxID=104099 RepID=A0A4Y3TQP6_9PROT|nr:hypothetical protein Abol_050_015 [Acetobacter orleanensis JCM 7639]GBR26113.1 hypothetical protein AA0473_1062 [Acetobacter orleanensis NRIC 0473]GEB83407.1 hypothetical protein AOR01nite_18840 [Acetobacter orleanensis]